MAFPRFAGRTVLSSPSALIAKMRVYRCVQLPFVNLRSTSDVTYRYIYKYMYINMASADANRKTYIRKHSDTLWLCGTFSSSHHHGIAMTTPDPRQWFLQSCSRFNIQDHCSKARSILICQNVPRLVCQAGCDQCQTFLLIVFASGVARGQIQV